MESGTTAPDMQKLEPGEEHKAKEKVSVAVFDTLRVTRQFCWIYSLKSILYKQANFEST